MYPIPVFQIFNHLYSVLLFIFKLEMHPKYVRKQDEYGTITRYVYNLQRQENCGIRVLVILLIDAQPRNQKHHRHGRKHQNHFWFPSKFINVSRFQPNESSKHNLKACKNNGYYR